MSAEATRFNPAEWEVFKDEALSQLCFFFGVTPTEELNVIDSFERLAADVESGTSFITKEGFQGLIEDIIVEADARGFNA